MSLPDKPSELLAVALRDLEKCEKDPRFEIDMNVWCERTGTGHCAVCLAGSVMMQSLNGMPGPVPVPDLELITDRKLRALDHMRSGHIQSAMMLLGRGKDVCPRDRQVPRYDHPTGTGPWKRAMRKLLADLVRADL